MMTNLFSAFDPSTSTNWSVNWTSLLFIMLYPPTMWVIPSRYTITFMILQKMLYNEFSMLMKNSKGMKIMFMALFNIIMINNIMGLIPYTFTMTSHMMFSMSMSLPLWITLMMFGWIKKTNHMFSHMIPASTPTPLMPIMVCIESISNIIRPWSLAMRLSANMIAGHLIMSLLGNSSMNKSTSLSILMWLMMLLMMFEMMVAIIQAYVFSILSILYSSEVN
uniref:ATP synthase subunit a n=1 Tax=Kokeshia sp. NKU02 TaxID=1124182 RepID=A0A0X8NSI5_9HEMI|nr:ATP synthase F0 subunit 6 [Kokeshia sp. NKU02]